MNLFFYILLIILIVLIAAVNNTNQNNTNRNDQSKIFPYFVSATHISDDKLKEYQFADCTQDSNEIIFLTKWKEFVNDPNVFSLAEQEQIDQVSDVLKNIIQFNVAGDVVEIGVWRGGMAMWMKQILKKYHTDKYIYLYDTFDKFSVPQHPTDKKIEKIVNIMYSDNYNEQVVINNFKKFNLWDDKIKLIKGDIKETCRYVPNKIAMLRIDCDYYEPVLISLVYFYKNISKGGYVIVDDYHSKYVGCGEAVDFFRNKYHINNPIFTMGHSIHWQV